MCKVFLQECLIMSTNSNLQRKTSSLSKKEAEVLNSISKKEHRTVSNR